MVYKEGKLRLVATDTHRLAVRDCALVSSTGARTARSSSRTAPWAKSSAWSAAATSRPRCNITLSGNQVLFEVDRREDGRVHHADLPLDRRHLPLLRARDPAIVRSASSPSSATRCLSAIRRAAIVARESQNRVVLRTSDEQSGGERLNITASSGNLGNAFEEVEIVREGSESSSWRSPSTPNTSSTSSPPSTAKASTSSSPNPSAPA